MNIIICPGIHQPELTNSFISALHSLLDDDFDGKQSEESTVNILTFDRHDIFVLSQFNIFHFLKDNLSSRFTSPVIFIAFSAGVIGAIGAATIWQMVGGNVKAFIAIDGWGVPLWGSFPIHRMSHDEFSHWSSSLLGSGEDNFYANPDVDHLTMWRSPLEVKGDWINSSTPNTVVKQHLSAGYFLQMLLSRYSQL
jgi:hypothetical protein